MATAAPPQQPSRFRELLSGIPLVTVSIMAICIVVVVADNLGDFYANIGLFSISAYHVIYKLELYRIVSAAFTHGGVLHIGMNMMSLYQLGVGLEPLFGSLQYFFIMTMFTIAVGCVYVLISVLVSLAWDPVYFYGSAVGFSGVLFAMAVDEASLSPFPTRSVLGLFSVPTKVYPWVLMLILQFMMPNVSLIGHLSGILVGFAHTWGWLGWAVPGLATLRRVEASSRFTWVKRLSTYKLVPNSEVVRGDASAGSMCREVGNYLGFLVRPITNRCCPNGWRRMSADAAESSGNGTPTPRGPSWLSGLRWPTGSSSRGGTEAPGPGGAGPVGWVSAPASAPRTAPSGDGAEQEQRDLEAAIAASLDSASHGSSGSAPAVPTAPFRAAVGHANGSMTNGGIVGSALAGGGNAPSTAAAASSAQQRSEAAERAAAAAMARLASKGFSFASSSGTGSPRPRDGEASPSWQRPGGPPPSAPAAIGSGAGASAAATAASATGGRPPPGHPAVAGGAPSPSAPEEEAAQTEYALKGRGAGGYAQLGTREEE